MDTPGSAVEAADFSEITDEFHIRVARMARCNVAAVDQERRPRSRIMHPLSFAGRVDLYYARPSIGVERGNESLTSRVEDNRGKLPGDDL